MDNKAFVKDALSAHNDYRKRHQVAPLKLSDSLTKIAQKWADHLAAIGSLQHSSCAGPKGERLGENVAFWAGSGSANKSGRDVTNMWYSEVSKYSYGSSSGSGGTGHFSQVVWKDSKELGLGRAKTSDGRWFVVGNYLPAGNMMGTYNNNVFPPKDGNISLIQGSSAKKSDSETAFASRVSNPSYQTRDTWNPKYEVKVNRNDVTQHSRNQPEISTNKTRGFSQGQSHGDFRTFEFSFNNPDQNTARCHSFQLVRDSEDDKKKHQAESSGHKFDSGPRQESGGHMFPSSGFKDNKFGSGFPEFESRGHQRFQSGGSSSSGQVVSRQTKTITEGCGANRVTKTIVTETIVQADGSRKTITTESVTQG